MAQPVPHQHRCGICRREFLQVGFLGSLGMVLADILASREAGAETTSSPFGKAKSAIIVWMTGGPAQMGTWDPKPEAKEIVRGQYKAINTNVPGIQISDLLPMTAQNADKFSIIRTITLGREDDNHNIGTNLLLTGLDNVPPGTNGVYKSPNDWPCYGSALTYARPSKSGLPTAVNLPTYLTDSGGVFPGQHAGLLGMRYDPWHIIGRPFVLNTGNLISGLF